MINNNKRLNTYIWEGVNPVGESCCGILEAGSIEIAKIDLRNQGIFISRVSMKRRPPLTGYKKSIKHHDIALFSRQLATLIEAGIPLTQGLDIIIKGLNNQQMQRLVHMLKLRLEGGFTFAEALAQYPQYFNTLYCNLINAGEKSGNMDKILLKLSQYQDHIERNKAAVKKALTYPIIILLIAGLVTLSLLLFVVPQFEALFKNFGAEMPALTKCVVRLSKYCKRYWYFMPLIVTLSWLIISRKGKFHQSLHQLMDYCLLKLPILGRIIRHAITARFAHTLSITLAGGLPLTQALQAVAGATGNHVYSHATEQIHIGISSGLTMQESMSKTPFPSMFIQMIAVGEESGSLEQLLAKAASYYEEDVDHAIATLNHLLEPLIMSLLGLITGGLILAMYLPVFKLGTAL